MKKLRVGILFGGKSTEHEVSLQSAKNVIAHLDPEKFESVLLLLNKEGEGVVTEKSIVELRQIVDVIFPVLHGGSGEDGTVQGLLKLSGIPFVGAGVLGSAIGMDKDVMKRLLRDAGIPIAQFLTIQEKTAPLYEEVVKVLGIPFFVKPANAGSSVGVHKVENATGYTTALRDAFLYDTKVLIEETIVGREIEVAVLGNENPQASVPGEIIPKNGFYSYEAKYLDSDGAKLRVPAQLDAETSKKIQEQAKQVFQVLSCEGIGRVDFFLRENGDILVNEINTLPGFTAISMYPKLWETSGVSYKELITRLIELAFERHKQEKKLKTSYQGVE
jgi:D-alanine-D-alanine ligase